MTQRQVQLITDFKADIIMVTPSYMLAIADEFERQGIDPRSTNEEWHLRRRALDQRAPRRDRGQFDMHGVDIYGLSEVMGPGVANEAVEEKDGLYVWEDHFFPRSSIPRPARRAPTARRASLSSPR